MGDTTEFINHKKPKILWLKILVIHSIDTLSLKTGWALWPLFLEGKGLTIPKNPHLLSLTLIGVRSEGYYHTHITRTTDHREGTRQHSIPKGRGAQHPLVLVDIITSKALIVYLTPSQHRTQPQTPNNQPPDSRYWTPRSQRIASTS